MRRPLPPIAARPEAKARRGPRTTLRLFHPAAARKRGDYVPVSGVLNLPPGC
jgi:hypothetical protein